MLDTTSARVTTLGEKAVDVFDVTDLTGRPIASETRPAALRPRLVEVMLDGRGDPTGSLPPV